MIERDTSGYMFREREIIVVNGSDRQMGREREREYGSGVSRERENEILG